MAREKAFNELDLHRATEEPLFVIEYFDTGALILNTRDARMAQINTTGASILRMAETGGSNDSIISDICLQYGIEIDEARDALLSLQNQLHRLDIPMRLVNGSENWNGFQTQAEKEKS